MNNLFIIIKYKLNNLYRILLNKPSISPFIKTNTPSRIGLESIKRQSENTIIYFNQDYDKNYLEE